MTALPRRRPGVRFEVPTQALREALPRMDIGLFVGFTACGPLDLPVAVESLGEFETVFGDQIVLARTAGTAGDVTGLLHPCVRGFFSAGGRRCWVVRVAAPSARVTRFPLANLLLARRPDSRAAWRFEPALTAARSAGSWADGLTVATRLAVQSLTVQPVGQNHSTISVDALGPPALALRPGDLLRFTVHGDRLIHARVDQLDPPASGPHRRLRRRLRLRGVCALAVPDVASPAAPVSHVIHFEPAEDGDGVAQVEHRVIAQGASAANRLSLRYRMPATRVPGIGAVLKVIFADGATAWTQVTGSVLTETGDADGRVDVEVSGRLWTSPAEGWRGDLESWVADGREHAVEWLRLDLRARATGEDDFILEGLTMAAPADAAAAGSSITTLPDDQWVFGTHAARPADVSAAASLLRRDSLGRLTRRFPLASPPGSDDMMLIPLGNEQEFGPGLGAAGIDRPRLERDGLADFSWQLFAEPLLADASSDTLADQAEALRFLSPRLRPLRGMHAAFGSDNTAVVDEPTLLAIPDAVQPGWDLAANPLPAWTDWPAPAPDPEPACDCDFADCTLTPLAAPRFVRGADPDVDGDFLLQWTQPEPGVSYELEEASDVAFAAATVPYRGSVPRFAVIGKRPGSQFYRVRASIGPRLSAWSRVVEVRIGLSGYAARTWQPDNLLAIHRLMLRTAAGRGDMLAVLGLPRHYGFSDAVAHASALRDPADASSAPPDPRPIGVDEVRALSHGALYHPWLLTRRAEDVVASPPDGSVCGQLAAGAIDRGAWLAVANQPLRDVVALSAPASATEAQQLLDAQVNLICSGAYGFVLAAGDTLSPESDWRPINVRRLMTLLRRLALRRGATYLFEPNGATLRRTVERGFTAVMDELFRRGAFAGATAAAAYRVAVGDEVNTPQRHDLGQFRVDLQVAPALPLTFLTVRLARSGERLVARETR